MYITNLGGHINDNINMFVLGKNPTKLKKYMKRQTITRKSVIKLSSILRFILFAIHLYWPTHKDGIWMILQIDCVRKFYLQTRASTLLCLIAYLSQVWTAYGLCWVILVHFASDAAVKGGIKGHAIVGKWNFRIIFMWVWKSFLFDYWQ